ncbi:MAG: tRNA (adenosine(37)-N6)-threonylcarbamoyltransferase complex transferase subunit TsaD [Alphaproteobacteria bacterium CG_4_9_14_3_um_filter_47_13]|nr:MAG: tRNA (adenosine(37)-N6)-threonylcarbamoyltransferase complex transferase subunit TsaD [Alphaproteobacteria bacterium CG_4_9_14_3_um_filter_47_13]
MRILGIETSCDETAAAIVEDNGTILSNLVLSQLDEHRVFGGVVPEIAARAHLENIHKLVEAALEDAGVALSGLDGIAATCGPGLIGGVMIGMMTGKAIAAACNLPFIGVNHLEAHALTPRLTDKVAFPYLLLLVSGGHTQILIVHDVGHYRLLGTTIDDALGECFDKSAKLMGLPYPGGPHLEKAARQCLTPAAAREQFPLPRPMKGRTGCDFSFSGLKTAVRLHIDRPPPGTLLMNDVAALACSFENAVCETLVDRCENAIIQFLGNNESQTPAFVIAGGVAANNALRTALKDLTARHHMSFIAPPAKLCSDNAAMIAWAGVERLGRGMTDKLDIAAKPRWPLDPEAGYQKQVETT